MDIQRMLGWLVALEMNNTREFFHENKDWHREATATFELLVDALMAAVRTFDPAIGHVPASKLTFRLMRDTRFAADKSPYNPTFRAHIGREGKLPIPCDYYVSLAPGNRSFLGGGLFAPMFADATRRIRDAIAARGDDMSRVLADMQLSVQGEALKRVPKGYDPEHAHADLLRHKSFYVEMPVPDALLLTPDVFVQHAEAAFKRMKPFNDFLNEALEGFEMPARR